MVAQHIQALLPSGTPCWNSGNNKSTNLKNIGKEKSYEIVSDSYTHSIIFPGY